MTQAEEMKLSGIWPQLILTVLVAAATTIGANYTHSKITETVNNRQSQILDDLEKRVRDIESTRYTDEDAKKDREYIIRELDRIYDQLEKVEKKL